MKTLFFENTAPRISEREAERHLAQEVGQVLGHQPCDNLYWQGSTTDLMEALHLAYTSFRLTDAEGLCLSFAYIVDRGCAVLHVARPTNPYELAARGSRRKGLHRTSYLQRYMRRMDAGVAAPLWKEITTPTD
jgi:hypothetical protein